MMVKYLGIAIVVAVATYLLKDTVATLGYSTYKDTLSALLNISSIIFAIIGAWIAIIYPRAIGRVFKSAEVKEAIKDSDNDADYLGELVEIVMVSAIVLMFVLAIQFAVPIFKGFIVGSSLIVAKYAAFYIVTLLTISQLIAVFRVILANYFFLNELRRKNIQDKVNKLND